MEKKGLAGLTLGEYVTQRVWSVGKRCTRYLPDQFRVLKKKKSQTLSEYFIVKTGYQAMVLPVFKYCIMKGERS